MAGEIVPVFALNYQPLTGRPLVIPQFSLPITQSATQLQVTLPLVIPTADTVISLAALTTLGMLYIENTDAVNFLDIGPTVAGAIAPMLRLHPGEWQWFRLKPGIVLRGIADTAAVPINITAFNN